MLWVVPESSSDLIAFCHGIHVSKRGRVLWMVAVLAILWVLWLERNRRIFAGGGNSLDSVWERVRFWGFPLGYMMLKDFKNFSFSAL